MFTVKIEYNIRFFVFEWRRAIFLRSELEMDKNGRDGSTPTALWRVATAIYIRAMHFHRRIDNASVRLSACGYDWSEESSLLVRRFVECAMK